MCTAASAAPESHQSKLSKRVGSQLPTFGLLPSPPPTYLWIWVRAEAPKAEPVPAWPYPNSCRGYRTVTNPVRLPRVKLLFDTLKPAGSLPLFLILNQWISGGYPVPLMTSAIRAAKCCCDAAGRESGWWRHCLCRGAWWGGVEARCRGAVVAGGAEGWSHRAHVTTFCLDLPIK